MEPIALICPIHPKRTLDLRPTRLRPVLRLTVASEIIHPDPTIGIKENDYARAASSMNELFEGRNDVQVCQFPERS